MKTFNRYILNTLYSLFRFLILKSTSENIVHITYLSVKHRIPVPFQLGGEGVGDNEAVVRIS